jgi:folate-binding protein YgfZ
MRRLTLYRLRARVEFSMENPAVVLVSFGDESPGENWITDSRFSRIAVWRHYGDAGIVVDAGEADWHRLRVMHGVGESGADFAPGDAFPHDVLFDRNGGVSFAKGCYVGQEVVSRMQHRGTARRRLILAEAGEDLPPPGTGIVAGGRAIGTLGSVSGRHGLAMVRIDRAGRAMADGVAILAGETEIRLAIPEWAGFGFPAEAGED